MKRRSIFFFVLGLFLSVFPLTAEANHCRETNPCSEYLVKFSPQATPEKIGALLHRENLVALDYFKHTQIYHLVGDPSQSKNKVLERLNAEGDVVYAEPNYTVHTQGVPNDSRFSEQWALHNTGQSSGTVGDDLGMEQVWDTLTGSPQMIVAIIDSGIDYTHEDLSRNIWINTREIPGNHIDDDGDGLVDDYYGYNFYAENNDPMDNFYHGSHVAGIIGAVGNNGIGVTGINWNVKLMAIKVLDASGGGTTSDLVRGIEYAIDHGAKVINASWGFFANLTSLPTDPTLEPNQSLRNAIAAADQAGVIFVAASGNYTTNTDQKPFYPAAYSLKNIISVAATDNHDALASFSDYGAVSVDLGAPGQSILSTYPTHLGMSYAYASGTSMATPFVAGAAALLWSANPALTHRQVIDEILQGVEPDPALQGKTVTGGRLDIARSLALGATQTNHPPVANAGPDQYKTVSQIVTLTGSATDQDGDALTYQWTLHTPTGSRAVLNSTISQQVSFTPDMAGTYQAILVVSDGKSSSVPDTATIQVSTAPTTTPPTVSLRVKRNGVSITSNQINVGDLITLDGSGSSSSNGAPLTYRWAFVTRPSGSTALMNNATSAIASFKPDLAGSYTVSLTISDGKLSSSGEVALWANAVSTTLKPPTVSIRIKDNGLGITSNQIKMGDLITFDGSGSVANGPSLSYLWFFGTKPTGSLALLSNPTSSISSFKPDKAGQYIVYLKVSNGTYSSQGGVSLWANLVSSASIAGFPEEEMEGTSAETDSPEDELPPLAAIEASQGGKALAFDLFRGTSTDVGEKLMLDGSPSSAPLGLRLLYQWSLVEQPEGSGALIEDTEQETSALTPDLPGRYTVRLTVNDGNQESTAELPFLAETKTAPGNDGNEMEASEVGGCALQGLNPIRPPWTWMGGLGVMLSLVMTRYGTRTKRKG